MRSPPPFELMHWAKRSLGPAPYPLGRSGTPSPSSEEFEAVVGRGSTPPTWAHCFSSIGDEGGVPDLRAAIGNAYGVGPDQVLVSDGTSLANYSALAGLAGPGDRILVEAPTYPALAEIPAFAGANVLGLERRVENGWCPSLDDIEVAAGNGPLAAVVLSRLHNPSGADLPSEFLEGLATLAERRDFLVMLDEVYLDFLHDAVPGFRFSPRFLCTGSLSKVNGFGGLRIGWILAAPEIIGPLLELSYYLAVNASAPAQSIALQVLATNDHWLARARDRAERHRALITAWIESRPDVHWTPTAGGLNYFLRLDGVDDTKLFADRLLKEHGVALAAGEFFGRAGWVRISVGTREELLVEGLRRVGVALDAHPE